MAEPKFRVAICGGGIGGLILAIALLKYPDIRVDIYEAADEFKEIGAGIMMWGRTWRIFLELGLKEDMAKIAFIPDDDRKRVAFDFRKADLREEGFQFSVFESPYGCIRFHRAHFLDVLVDRLPKDIAHFSKKLILYREDHECVTMAFADGTTSTCDLLVGCDGIKSTVRKEMYEQAWRNGSEIPNILSYDEPIWSGSVTYRALVPAQLLKEEDGTSHRILSRPMIYCGQSKHVVAYGIAKDRIGNVVAFVTEPEREGEPFDDAWISEPSKQDLVDAFEHFEPEVRELLQKVENPSLWAIHELRPLPFWVSNKVALLGDAAHAMTPHQGAGAGQAIEDAYILAALLGDRRTKRDNIPNVLTTYEHIRMPIVHHTMRGSNANGKLYEFNGEPKDDLKTLGEVIGKQWDWLWETPPAKQIELGLELLYGERVRARL
ncbi:hypothetical protein NLI96_g2428 [Meripilus lineatus]|uniref:FAD-binding domain-containing protein n=1 Tax=Meripilus lineatus TaxID=2056292 RepID=A0AAD5VE66_9APHY|nr:hypothetical protein NLI96_g2428 [Physisporinus lineatus]